MATSTLPQTNIAPIGRPGLKKENPSSNPNVSGASCYFQEKSTHLKLSFLGIPKFLGLVFFCGQKSVPPHPHQFQQLISPIPCLTDFQERYLNPSEEIRTFNPLRWDLMVEEISPVPVSWGKRSGRGLHPPPKFWRFHRWFPNPIQIFVIKFGTF